MAPVAVAHSVDDVAAVADQSLVSSGEVRGTGAIAKPILILEFVSSSSALARGALIDIAAKTTAKDVAAANNGFGMDLNVIGSFLWVVVGQRTGFLGVQNRKGRFGGLSMVFGSSAGKRQEPIPVASRLSRSL